MSEENLLNLQSLVGNYLNGFKIVSVQKDPFIKGQINLFTDSTEDIGFGDRSVIKFWVRDEKNNAAIYREQINKDTWILTEFEKWLETILENEKFCYLSPHGEDRYRYNIFKEVLDKLQELKGNKNEIKELCKKEK